MFTLFTIQKAGEGIILTTQPRKLLGIFVFKTEFINRLGKKKSLQSWHGRNKSLWYCRDKISIYVLGVFFSNSQKNVHPRLCDNLFNYSASFAFLINFENRVPLHWWFIHQTLPRKSSHVTSHNWVKSSLKSYSCITLFTPTTLHPPPPYSGILAVFNCQKTKAVLELIFFIKDSLQRYIVNELIVYL